MNINYEDRALFKAVLLKWEIIQVIWESHIINPSSDKIYLLKRRLLIKDRNEPIVESVFDGFKKENIFQKWLKEGEGYFLIGVIVSKLSIKYSELDKLYRKVAEAQNNKQTKPIRKLVIHKLGHIDYYFSGKKYNANFKIGLNDFKLLNFLAQSQNLYETFRPEELVAYLNDERQDSESLPERRIRNTIKSIRDKLGISGIDDPFIVSSKRFGLNCDVELIK